MAKGAKSYILNELRRRYEAEEPGLTKTEMVAFSKIPLSDIDEAMNKLESQGRIAVNAGIYTAVKSSTEPGRFYENRPDHK